MAAYSLDDYRQYILTDDAAGCTMTSFLESRAGMITTLAGMGVLVLVGLTIFANSVALLVLGLLEGSVVTFNKGDMYMLGAALSILFLLAGAVPKIVFRKELGLRREGFLIRGALAGVVAMFLLPQLAHLAVWIKVKDKPYVEWQQDET
ncbi:hypothetical protein ACXYTJ_15395 [Gilvimarinus sp. F26214L]|uniref:hypothetical protein n=1 Tax=Gilvimarinus sp. DZF01 TaxID=3461371 RepID=UPI0040461EF3